MGEGGGEGGEGDAEGDRRVGVGGGRAGADEVGEEKLPDGEGLPYTFPSSAFPHSLCLQKVEI